MAHVTRILNSAFIGIERLPMSPFSNSDSSRSKISVAELVQQSSVCAFILRAGPKHICLYHGNSKIIWALKLMLTHLDSSCSHFCFQNFSFKKKKKKRQNRPQTGKRCIPVVHQNITFLFICFVVGLGFLFCFVLFCFNIQSKVYFKMIQRPGTICLGTHFDVISLQFQNGHSDLIGGVFYICIFLKASKVCEGIVMLFCLR